MSLLILNGDRHQGSMKAYEERDGDVLSDSALRIYLRLAECLHHGIGTEVDLVEALNFIQLFRKENRRRVSVGETEAEYVIGAC